MPTAIYTIEAITNLHAGSGDSNYEIVDKEIQRDTATGLPTIYASSLKGALREFFEHMKWEHTDEVFGCSEDKAANKKQQPGTYSFLAADIAALPAPASESPYYRLVHCAETVTGLYSRKYKMLDFTMTADTRFNESVNDPVAFKEVAANLPVIARNQLNNGISQNLWYERVVPHKSVFITAIIYPEGDKHFEKFNELVTGKLVQIGGNATVGYGLCQFTNLNNRIL